ncbi:hypothetical protein MKZ38_006126 [Zalerion maritima]|uniref:Uncharacterized protein n=1 Tax=Zalerion maritima TaxID=339359 RepID=A0AAD5WQI5_9PEZI|nr:hypothetical protein MKZ38_006126 [Zalerion maritima]
MATTATTLVPGSFHAGESHIRSLLRVPSGPDPRQGNPTSIGLPRAYAYRASISPVIAVGALDAQLRPWATLWGGDRADAEAGGAGGGACAPVGQDVLGIRGTVDCAHDPVVGALFGGRVGKGEVVRADDGAEYAGEEKEEEKEEEEEEEATKGIGRGRRKNLMAALTIDFESRDRVKLAGKFVAGAVFGADEDEVGKGKDDEVARDDESESESKKKKAGALRLAFAVRESLGNCPKYLNKKDVRPVTPEPELVVENEGKDEGVLGPKALELIRRADMFFVSSCDGGECMDVNHRGGQEGFVRVLETGTRTGTGTGTGTGKGERESEGEGGKSVLVWPECEQFPYFLGDSMGKSWLGWGEVDDSVLTEDIY